MRSLHPQKRLHPQGDGEVESGLGILQVEAGDLPDPFEAVAQRVRMDAEALGRMLLLPRLEVRPQRGDERSLAGAVVLDQRSEMAPAVVDQPLVADRGEEAGEPQLRYGNHLAPPFEAGQRLHDGSDLAQGSG